MSAKLSAPKCTVIVPTYNRVELLRYTLESLVRQSIPCDEFEVVVVDDGSQVDTLSEISDFKEILNLRYFYQEDRGYRVAKARNVGIDHAQAPICIFVDSGVVLSSQCLASHLRSHNSHDEDVAVLGLVYGFNEDNEDEDIIKNLIDLDDVEKTLEKFDSMGKYLDLREEFFEKYGDSFNYLPAPWLMFWTGNASVKTDLIRKVGRFDEWFNGWGGEDIDLGYRLHEIGLDFVVERNAKSIHYPHDKSYDNNMSHAVKNYEYIHSKYQTSVTKLLPDTHFFVLNDLV